MHELTYDIIGLILCLVLIFLTTYRLPKKETKKLLEFAEKIIKKREKE